MRKLISVLALLIIGLLSLSLVSALDAATLAVDSVRIDGDIVTGASVLSIEEGQTMDIRLGLVNTAATAVNDIEVDAKISGYEYSDHENLLDSTPLFDVAAGTTKYVNLHVNMPRKLDSDRYTLRVRILDRNTTPITLDIPLQVEQVRRGVDIADVSFSPGNTVKAGRSLLTTVLLENFGRRNQHDVKVTVAVPELGISAVEYVDVDASAGDVDYQDVPEMFLPIPASAKAGDFTVEVTADFDQYQTVSKTFTIHVQANELAQVAESQERLVLAVGPETQNVAQGKTATYAVALTNAGTASKVYTVEAVTGDWATATLSESMAVLDAGKSKVVYVTVAAAADATAGAHPVAVTVKSGSDVLQTVTLSASVVAGQAAASSQVNLRNGLEIALIVLVVLLVIMGLIIGFSRMRKDSGDEQTYY